MYNIGKLAAMACCKPVTVRYYERAGLLKPPKRQGNGYRWYTEGDLEDLVFIRHCRSHGFSLDEIKGLLALKDAPEASCGLVDEIIERHIAKLDGLLKSVTSLRDQLSDLRCRCPMGGPVSECGIMRGLMDRSSCPCGDLGRGQWPPPAPGLGAAGVDGLPSPELWLPPIPEDGPAAGKPARGQARGGHGHGARGGHGHGAHGGHGHGACCGPEAAAEAAGAAPEPAKPPGKAAAKGPKAPGKAARGRAAAELE
jgi:DNA-binding transcriptional MerR regulator